MSEEIEPRLPASSLLLIDKAAGAVAVGVMPSAVRASRLRGDLVEKRRIEARKAVYDLEEALAVAGGPVIEVGGPTPQGFDALMERGITLPAELIIVNEKDLEGMDRKADAGRLPFADESIGVCLVSNLNTLNQNDIDTLNRKYCGGAKHYSDGSTEIDDDSFRRYKDELLGMISESYEVALRATDIKELAESRNPRIRLMAELGRTLKPAGLVIGQGISREDIAVASLVGLTIAEYDEEKRQAIFVKDPGDAAHALGS